MKGFSKQKGVGIRKLYSGGHEGRRAGWVLRDSFPQDGGAGGSIREIPDQGQSGDS